MQGYLVTQSTGERMSYADTWSEVSVCKVFIGKKSSLKLIKTPEKPFGKNLHFHQKDFERTLREPTDLVDIFCWKRGGKGA